MISGPRFFRSGNKSANKMKKKKTCCHLMTDDMMVFHGLVSMQQNG
jgi:hypothetical protein